jgi:hypothetical protein
MVDVVPEPVEHMMDGFLRKECFQIQDFPR